MKLETKMQIVLKVNGLNDADNLLRDLYIKGFEVENWEVYSVEPFEEIKPTVEGLDEESGGVGESS